jgi:antitoxin ChpS
MLYLNITKSKIMHTTNLRKVGGSIMLAIPPAVLEVLNLQSGTTVGVAVHNGRLIIEPQPKRQYSLDELLALCNPNAPITEVDLAWLDVQPVGNEL